MSSELRTQCESLKPGLTTGEQDRAGTRSSAKARQTSYSAVPVGDWVPPARGSRNSSS